MHQSALNYAKYFVDVYLGQIHADKPFIVDIGSLNVNGSIKDVLPSHIEYLGLDFEKGKGVDRIVTDPYSLPVDDETADIVVCSSVYEHSEMFWLLYLECLRILKPDGLLYINCPSNGMMHRFPIDAWRFYPDSGKALEVWAEKCGLDSLLLESFVGNQLPDIGLEGHWNDFVAIFLKDKKFESRYKHRISDKKTDLRNVIAHKRDFVLEQYDQNEDLQLIGDFSEGLDKLRKNAKNTLDKHKQEIVNLTQDIEDRDLQLDKATITLESAQAHTDTLAEDLDKHKQEIVNLTQDIEDRDLQLDKATITLESAQAHTDTLAEDLDKHKQEIVNLTQDIEDRDLQLELLKEDKKYLLSTIQAKEVTINRIYNSKSWKLTLPLRLIGQFSRSLIQKLKRYRSIYFRYIWTNIPLSFKYKQLIKYFLFHNVGGVFKNTIAFKNWKYLNTEKNDDRSVDGFITCKTEISNHKVDNTNISPDYVALLDAPNIKRTDITLLAFYLPQFHAIPENDEWWGKGFTEWTNVKPSKPKFKGHYQPHIPGELGYYDLSNINIMRRQSELAKLYGVGGFIFYFYWFGGKRLLETPVAQFHNNSDIDFPYCLCWANENWSRRWDGLDQDILISQEHSEQDDLAFIEYVSKYMKDDRYIRIDDKPVLLVYRPSLLPSAKDTVKRWRNWCQANGIGEIYLAYTQSFESVDPHKYGFDAAIEFPPNNMNIPLITDKIPDQTDEFTGQIYNWKTMVERSVNYDKPDYTLFRGVNPSWDNTARKKNNGNILFGSNPFDYQKWLYNAMQDTIKGFNSPEEKIVVINAWNEWAEGAHLEPDQHYGYAYLEATRMALARSEHRVSISKNNVLAIVIHAFYVDVFKDILTYISNIKVNFKLYVTTPFDSQKGIEKILIEFGHAYHLLPTKNRGRDVLPFIKIMPVVKENGHELLLKLHTKKSKHREDGELWRNDVLDKLLLPKNIKRILKRFYMKIDLGMVGPDGHVVDMSTYWGSNESKVIRLAKRMGVDESVVMASPFVAGTMFYARISAIDPLLNLALSECDFEVEKGQVDGTLAHAIERAFALSLISSDYQLSNSNDVTNSVNLDSSEKNYKYADKEKL
jgi:lipopolysaccharide biosynthesis protein/SAM-dependent methyltransferase/exonuclease VII small subunit